MYKQKYINIKLHALTSHLVKDVKSIAQMVCSVDQNVNSSVIQMDGESKEIQL